MKRLRKVGRLKTRQREKPEYELYQTFIDDHPCRFCWHCGATRKPSWWHAPWMLERAHIVNKPRIEDRRVVILLCSTCHRVQHGDRFKKYEHERLDVVGMVALKKRYDPEFFDLEFLNRHTVSKLS